MTPRLRLSVAAALAAWLASVVPAPAQVRTAERGWIGISVERLTTLSSGRSTTVVTVTDVIDESPASRAGIRPGDVLVSLNGRSGDVLVPLSGNNEGRGLLIRPGEAIHVVVERDGARRTVTMNAASRPEHFRFATSWTFEMREDSVADRMYRAMDSLKVRLFERGGQRVTVVGSAPGREEARVEIVGGSGGEWRELRTVGGEEPFGLPGAFTFPEVRAPFMLLVLEGPTRDSLRAEMEVLNRRIRETRARHETRLRQIGGGGTARIVLPPNDPELSRIEGTLADLRVRSAALQEAIERAAQAELRSDSRWATVGDDERDLGTFRPLAPYVLGQNRAAGAEVVDLRPELADYFGVDGGVLVVDVADGTPAALAGLLPGDVLTHLNDRRVASITELRMGLARGDADASVRIVRKGRPITLTLLR